MIKFFRRIRQQLLSENKFSKYLLYAIGEIVLVVIGILIALQINNWNEAKANEARLIKILKEIRLDLETDVINSERILISGKEIDSLSRLVLVNKFSKEDYKEKGPRNLFWVGLQFQSFDYQKTAFTKFENFQGIIPEKYDAILKDINYYYNDVGQLHDDIYLNLRQQIKDRHDYLANTTDWYHKMRAHEVTEQMVDFYANNPIYKNWVSQHIGDNTAGKYGTINALQTNGFYLLQQINNLLNDSYNFKDSKIIKKYGKPIPYAKELVGKYRATDTNWEFTITELNGYTYNDKTDILKEKSKDTLIGKDDDSLQTIVVRDKDGKVIGLKLIKSNDTTFLREATKIKDN
ncbi:DUF6090 family protein [Winogradskyella jejuensis]|uniref:Uncharacterized protein n=1 Tax=Winogradskyella jejuensis TaxID=1089305 RepID=A0A1M5SV58_9FLAO|nr:DUF6090 family protein [Winogradskyella jejuensis]SHH42148.1 hypothetical protein SAMN05444148_1975 [Winogradskyella jejuensis]